ncbi:MULTISPECIES: 5-(carboxyamino)imidazole ribonucleotide synthase [Vibrio]|uniref:N5-carboxyaminoimidazole ribonucleotide synthase n=1 Tax=Vibrio casei TaxID=673372 RepID=A0A368LK64_9VIBR|nr:MULTISPECIES: 5-(carboxyamino)imidazole ribonucleotide synthase [Vibrio]RCS72228.1 5-(carboxyamino)imidazole ribonucleotide synthase [Vibrio casei]SJN22015.1 Phosphoribosylaminoimidazole carboxylase ATPase subunit [Vibrio casei]HBV76465.1 5-(carboxyamino)imidazole ribonucleotide synthase [Vibrio sp.]
MVNQQVLVLGAGQLARMMSLAGAPLNIDIAAFDVDSEKIIHPLTQHVIGHGLNNAIAQANVITAEFEHIPHSILEVCERSGKLQPSTQAIKAGGDRRIEKQLLDDANVANAKYTIITNRSEFDAAIAYVGVPMVLKTALGGYDGKGQWRLKQLEQVESIWQEMEQSLLNTPHQAIVAEEFVPFGREVSLIGARRANGDIVVYPLAENIHVDGVLSLSTAINEPELQEQAKKMFIAIADKLNYVGVLAIEFFDVEGLLLVNEIAPRVHNSGHWTQQGAEVCQFENHLRAVCNLPLGDTRLIRPTAMVNILGLDTLPEAIFDIPNCHTHWYGKEKRSGRKMGHINICADSSEQLNDTLKKLASILPVADFPALHKH